MPPILQDIVFATGLVWWALVALFGITFVIVGAVEVIRQRFASPHPPARRRVASSEVGDEGLRSASSPHASRASLGATPTFPFKWEG